MIFNIVRILSFFTMTLFCSWGLTGTTDPIFTIVDRAPWNVAETISSSFGVTDPAGNHWVGSSSSSGTQQSGWKLRTYSQDQFAGVDKANYPEVPNSKTNFVDGLAFKNDLVAAVGFSFSSGSGASGVARISYDKGQTWNDLNSFSCGTGQLTNYTSADFADPKTIFISGFCVDLTGTSRWFVRRGVFDESEMQWFWSNSDQLVGRDGVNHFATQVLTSKTGEVLVSGYVRNERGSNVLIRSTADRGRTWRTIANPISTPEALSVHSFTQDPSGRMYLIVSTGPGDQTSANLFVSDDNGRTWTLFYGWMESLGTLNSRIGILVRGQEIVLVGSTKMNASGNSFAWVRRTTAFGVPWNTYEFSGEFDLGARLTGVHQFGISPIMVSGTDRMPSGEDRVTYRTFKPRL